MFILARSVIQLVLDSIQFPSNIALGARKNRKVPAMNTSRKREVPTAKIANKHLFFLKDPS